MSLAGDLDIVVGEFTGSLNYIENTGASTAPVFVRRTGRKNPFDVDSTPGICATSWSSASDGPGCETAQSGCPPVACDGDDEPWCCNEGFEVSCLEWHYCGDVSGEWDDDGVVGDCLDEGGWARCLTTAYEKGEVTCCAEIKFTARSS